jgi:histidinol-phosphate aminotransferase
MYPRKGLSRRGFVGGVAGALGYMGLKPGGDLLAQGFGSFAAAREAMQSQEYDGMAKVANNENPWGPSQTVLKAMNDVWKYSNRYGYPDPGVAQAVAQHHGVQPENILFGAGSSETLTVMGQTFLAPGKKVIGCMPTYMSVYNYATGIGAEGLTAPLNADGTQDIEAMVQLAKRNYRDVGFFYLVNPNNPTGVVVTKEEVAYVMNELPEDMMVLMDEAYHHFVDDPRYETAMGYVKEGRNVVVARTFSKIYGLAGMRLGYGVAPAPIIARMRRTITGTQNINALVKFAAVAALKDTADEARVRNETIAMRKKAATDLEALGYKPLPTQANFYMVHIRRPVQEVIPMFRDRGVLVGRAFPPMNDYMRVSIGLPEENARFLTAFRQIFTGTTSSSRG